MEMKFYKGVLESDLKSGFIPGTVTTCIKEANMWKERISSNKKRDGKSRHVQHGKAVVVEICYTGKFQSCNEFQRQGIHEHQRMNCWTSSVQDKAQINTFCEYKVLTEDEIFNLMYSFKRK